MSSRRLNVVYVSDIPHTGGAPECLYDLVRGMKAEYGVECNVLFPANGPIMDRMEAIGAHTLATGHRGFLVAKPQSTWKVAPKYAIEFVRYHANRRMAIQRAEAAIDFSKVDIIHSNMPRNDLGMMLASRHNIPHVCHLREFSFEGFRCWSYQRKPERYLSEGTDAFIAVSKACANAWARRGLNRKKIHLVYDGIDLRKYQCGTVATKQSHAGMVKLIFLGGCNEIKGIMDTIEAIALLSECVRKRVTLDIFGQGSRSCERTARRRIKELDIEDRVRICGVNVDVPTLLPNYDIGLVCSRSEAFGRVVVEYQASGLAVIGSDAGSLPELLAEGERGRLYAKERGAMALAAEIERLVLDERGLSRLKERGPSFATAFDSNITTEQCMSIYEELLRSVAVDKTCSDLGNDDIKTRSEEPLIEDNT